jgi:chromate transporter
LPRRRAPGIIAPEVHAVNEVATTYLLPGPTLAQLAMFLGYARAGWMGALVAGVCFVVPGSW